MRLAFPISGVLLFVVYAVVIAFPAPPATQAEAKPDALTARDVLDRMASAYKECKSYRDSGVVKSAMFDRGEDPTENEQPFRTAFVRPDRFRFEFTSHVASGCWGPVSRYVVWRNGERVQTYWDITPTRESQKSIGMALAGATGVSGGSAHTIPALLMPKEVGGRLLTDMTELEKLDDAKSGELECFRVQGKFGESARTVWIDQISFLVRRIDEISVLPNGVRVEETTTYDPEINKDIPGGMLEFSAPKPK